MKKQIPAFLEKMPRNKKIQNWFAESRIEAKNHMPWANFIVELSKKYGIYRGFESYTDYKDMVKESGKNEDWVNLRHNISGGE